MGLKEFVFLKKVRREEGSVPEVEGVVAEDGDICATLATAWLTGVVPSSLSLDEEAPSARASPASAPMSSASELSIVTSRSESSSDA